MLHVKNLEAVEISVSVLFIYLCMSINNKCYDRHLLKKIMKGNLS